MRKEEKARRTENKNMSTKDYSPLPQACGRALVDKCYQKRKGAAIELQGTVKDLLNEQQYEVIFKIIKLLGGDLAHSENINARKGGLVGLGSAAVALEKESYKYTNELLLPALASFHHSDYSVQYYACEAVFNIVKVVRSKIFPFFIEVFDGLSKLIVHPDDEVRGAAAVLDRLLKDIVAESSNFDLVVFLPKLREGVYTINVLSRHFILSWIEFLDNIPGMNLLVFLPEVMDGLLNILGERTTEASKLCQNVLGEFLEGVRSRTEVVNVRALVNVLIVHSQSGYLLAQCTALTWLQEFCTLSPHVLLLRLASLLHAILPSLACDDADHRKVRKAGEALNNSLLNLVEALSDKDQGSWIAGSGQNSSSEEENAVDARLESSSGTSQVEVVSVLQVLLQYIGHTNIHTRVAVLKWIHHLVLNVPHKTFQNVPLFFHNLLLTLIDPSEEVLLLDLKILAEISSNPAGKSIDMSLFTKRGQGLQKVPPPVRDIAQTCQAVNEFFPHFMVELESFLQRHHGLFEDIGFFIVRHLAMSLGAEAVFSSLAEIILVEKDVAFSASVARSLNSILLTATELFELRCQLKEMKTKESRSLFCRLYRCWSHSPIATLSLCYLTQNYAHARVLLKHFGDVEITLEMLKEIDKLVQLLESPIFAYVRLHLLDIEKNGDLVQSLYGLLMMLPQSDVFRLLKCRLECIPHHSFSSSGSLRNFKEQEQDSRSRTSDIPFQELLDHFVLVQTAHRQARMDAHMCKLTEQLTLG